MRNASGPISAVYRKHEAIKKRVYGQRIPDIEHGMFTPTVFSTTGSIGPDTTNFYKILTGMLAWKENKPYLVVVSWLKCKLSFAAVRSAILCIRGTRSSIHKPRRDEDIALTTSDGNIP